VTAGGLGIIFSGLVYYLKVFKPEDKIPNHGEIEMENSNEFDGPKHIDSPADVKGDYEIVANI
jgi:hypothetical protein